MKKLIAAAALCAMAGVAVAQPVQTWGRYQDITINTTATGGGANVAGPVTNFPLLVRLNTTNASAMFAEVLPGGADLRFADANGTQLAYSIESWSDTAAIVWVRMPVVAGNGNTQLRMYWGKAGQASASNSAATFDGFTGVWHMNEAQGTGPQDATSNGINFTAHGAVSSVPGIIGNARYYNEGEASTGNDAGSMTTYKVDSINNTAASNGALLRAQANAAITVSAWVNRQGGSNGASGIFGQFRYSAGAHRSWSLLRNASGYRVIVSTEGTGDDISVVTPTNWGAATNNQWHHVTATISAVDGVRIYVNGNLEATETTPAQPFIATNAAARPLIGALERNFSQRFVGYVDELRFVNGAVRSPEWVKLDYETQRAGATALTFGAAQTNDTSRVFLYPQKVASYTQNVQITPNIPFIREGNTATAFSINNTLPAGLSFNTTTGVISGTPTALAASASYIVTATIGGNPHRDTLTIGVVAGNPPGAPTNVTAVAASGQATVTWAAPSVSGTTAITGYTVTATPGGGTCSWTTGPLSCTVTGLTNGTSYTFTVVASNSVGPGPASSPSTAVTPAGRPAAPTGVAVALLSAAGQQATATVSWTAPASDGGLPITGTFVFGSPTGACFAPAPNTSCTVGSLTYGTAYTFRAAASNSVGIGDTSAASEAFTPVNLMPGSFAIQKTGLSQPFTFTLSEQAMASTEAFTLSISDVWGRTIWSRTVHPSRDNVRELTWNGRNTSGREVSAGMYLVRVHMVNGGVVTDFVQKAGSLR